MDLKKENIIPYLETLSRLEKVSFLFEHINNKIKYDDEETVTFDLEVCETLLVQIMNSPLFASSDLELDIADKTGQCRDLSMHVERLKFAIDGLRSDLHEYLAKSLAF